MRLVLPVKDHELNSQKPLKIYGKPCWKSIFGSKKKNYYQIKFTLNLLKLYLNFISITFLLLKWNTCSGKCPCGEMSVRENVIRGTVRRGNVLSGNFPFGELYFGEPFFGELSVEELSVGEMSSGNCPDTLVSFSRYLNFCYGFFVI